MEGSFYQAVIVGLVVTFTIVFHIIMKSFNDLKYLSLSKEMFYGHLMLLYEQQKIPRSSIHELAENLLLETINNKLSELKKEVGV